MVQLDAAASVALGRGALERLSTYYRHRLSDRNPVPFSTGGRTTAKSKRGDPSEHNSQVLWQQRHFKDRSHVARKNGTIRHCL